MIISVKKLTCILIYSHLHYSMHKILIKEMVSIQLQLNKSNDIIIKRAVYSYTDKYRALYEI